MELIIDDPIQACADISPEKAGSIRPPIVASGFKRIVYKDFSAEASIISAYKTA